MKKALFTLLFILPFVSTLALSSQYEHCVLVGEVVGVERVFTLNATVSNLKSLAKIKIINASAMEGSYTDCQSFLLKDFNLVIPAGDVVSIGESLTLEYIYSDGFTPNGVVVSESITILN